MSDLLERLRQIDGWDYDNGGKVVETYYRNPDGPDAADEIERLMSANSRLTAVVDAARSEVCEHQHSIGYPCGLCDAISALDGEP